MKTQLWLWACTALLVGCKHEEPAPGPTEINLTVVDQSRTPLPKIEVLIGGSTGDYFIGTRHDTIFARRFTDNNGLMVYKATIGKEWEVFAQPIGLFDSTGTVHIYDISKFEGTVDGIIKVGQVNTITVIMKKR